MKQSELLVNGAGPDIEAAMAAAAMDMQDVVAIHALDGTVRWVSRKIEHVLDCLSEEMVGRSFVDRVLKEDLERFMCPEVIGKLHAGNEVVVSFRYRPGQGGIAWAESKLKPIIDGAGITTGFISISHDITERVELKRALTSLSLSEQRYFSLVEQSAVGIYVVQDGRIAYVNSTICRMVGYEQDELTSRSVFDLVYPDDVDKVQAFMHGRLKNSNELDGIRCRGVHKSGRIMVVEVHGQRVDYEGRPAISGLVLDITRQWEADQRIMESEQRFKALVQHSSDIITITTETGAIVYESESVERILGYRQGELENKNLLDYIHPEDQAEAHSAIEGLLTNPDQAATATARFRHKNGSWRIMQATGCNQLANPAVRGLVLNSRDITPLFESRRAIEHSEQELRMYAGELEQTKAELERKNRRLRSTVEELKISQGKAEDATRAKSEFLAYMSHEIRTPMNGVLGMTDLLLDTPLNQVQKEYAEAVQRSGESLLTLINDILDMSKIEAGKLELEKTQFDIRATAHESVELYAPQAEEKGIRLAAFVAPEVTSHAIGDPYRLGQVLNNLISNAIKFTEEGEVILKVTPAGETIHHVTLAFEVLDSGIGIPLDAQEQLFQAFEQGDRGTTRQYGGTGLGLKIARQLVELMGGSIELESFPGKGSVFRFTVRLRKDAESNPDAHDTSLMNERVLVVDSNDLTRMLTIQTLEAWGVRVEAVPSGMSALRRLFTRAVSGAPIPVTLIDGNPSDMADMALIRSIQAVPTISGTRLVLLRGINSVLSPEQSSDQGLFACLAKPYRQTRLKEILHAAIHPGTEPLGNEAVEGSVPGNSSARPERGRVLLAEDNEINQKVAQRLLERAGFDVDAVWNGREAVLAAEKGSYALILMDCQMPYMDGFAATRAIRQMEKGRPRVPIVALTANAMQDVRDRCLEAGMDDYLSKPFKRADLERTLDRWAPSNLPSHGSSEPRSAIMNGIEQLRQELGDDELRMLIRTFLESGYEYLESLRLGFKKENAAEVEAAAHALRGAALVFHADSLVEACHRLETQAATGTIRNSRALLEAVGAAFDETRHHLPR